MVERKHHWSETAALYVRVGVALIGCALCLTLPLVVAWLSMDIPD